MYLISHISYIFRAMLATSFVSIRVELEVALAWLSTLGGAFAALGDTSIDHVSDSSGARYNLGLII